GLLGGTSLMGMKWYYAENGERAGSATSEEIVKLIERDDAQPILIWAEGLAGGAEAEATKAPEPKKATLARRARNELIEYLAIAAYLAVCFAALLFYKAAILDSEGVDTTRVGLAIVKALSSGNSCSFWSISELATGESLLRSLF
ncbi:MAG: hypothetical protein WCF79_12915, partial [Rhodomicrobium sp.]